MPKQTAIELFRKSPRGFVDGMLVEAIGKKQLKAQSRWKPFLETYRGLQGDGDWDWQAKMKEVGASGRTGHFFSVEALGELQGLMIASSSMDANLHPEENLLYVDYLASAPWNRPGFEAPPGQAAPGALGKVGLALMLRAVFLSQELGMDGRVGLHSLKEAENFYIRSCHFTFLGKKVIYPEKDFMFCELPEVSAEFLIRTQEA